MTYRYHTELAPGCHSRPYAPVISRHRTWDAAVRVAKRNDRLVAVDLETGERFQIDQQDHSTLGAGRYGCGKRR